MQWDYLAIVAVSSLTSASVLIIATLGLAVIFGLMGVINLAHGTLFALGRRHFAVVQTHSLEHDLEWMRALLREPLAYLGLLGPRSRKVALLRELGVEGSEPAQLFAPVGLDLGAEGPEQIAISIVAEALAVHAGRSPDHLRARSGGIHEP